ncbi:MAG TPA: alpha/beta hydrolase [Flavitalea sp.]|nr:alpha/beta hydrolase [Flavitalea sp.]
MKTLYCISGLGADERVFSKLQISGHVLRPVKWLQPVKGEAMNDYAKRLSDQIKEPDPIIVGLSFGGMMAIEISKFKSVSKLILISSIKTSSELPGWMNLAGKAGAYNFLPSKQISSIKALRALRPIQNYFLGAKTEEEKKIANEYRDHVDPVYLKWAIAQVLTWKNDSIPSNLVHIHGSNDHIFPAKKIRDAHIVDGGGHFMIMDKPDQVATIIQREL